MIVLSNVSAHIEKLIDSYDIKTAAGGTFYSRETSDAISRVRVVRQTLDLREDGNVLSPHDKFDLLCEELADYLRDLMRQRVAVGVSNPSKLSPMGPYRYVFNRDDALAALLRNQGKTETLDYAGIDLRLSIANTAAVKEEAAPEERESLRRVAARTGSLIASHAPQFDLEADYRTIVPKVAAAVRPQAPGIVLEIELKPMQSEGILSLQDRIEMFASSFIFHALLDETDDYEIVFKMPTESVPAATTLCDVTSPGAQDNLAIAAWRSYERQQRPNPMPGLQIRFMHAHQRTA